VVTSLLLKCFKNWFYTDTFFDHE